jgi:outer membrane protein
MLYSRSVRAGALALLICSVPSLVQAESLREALTSAYQNSPDILSALLNIKATAEGIAVAKSEKLPTVGLSATESQGFAATGSGGSYQLSNPSVTVGGQYSQTIFDNFKSDADIEGARALTEASRYALQAAESNVLLQVATAYFAIIRDQQLVALASENVKFYQAQVSSAQDRLKIGEGTKIDVSQATARSAQGNAAYQIAVETLQTDEATYERFVGHKPGKLSMSYKLGSLLPSTLDAAINQAVSDNAQILAAKATIRARQAGSDAANAAFGPMLSMIAQIGATPLGANSSAGTSATPSGKVSFSLAVPLYAGGRFGATIRQANLNQMKSEVDALSVRDAVKQAVITAWSQKTSAEAQIQSANSAVSAGQLSLDGVVQERDVGQATTLDVLNAESDLITSRQTLIQATAGSAITAFSLVANTGHLTATDLGLSVHSQTGEDYIAKVEDVWAEVRALD